MSVLILLGAMFALAPTDPKLAAFLGILALASAARLIGKD